MPDYKSLTVEKAFESIPGISYNRLREKFAEDAGEDEAQPLFYEVVMDQDSSWEEYRARVYPQFARYVQSKHIDPMRPEPVIVAVFAGENCHLLEGSEFIGVLKEVDLLDDERLLHLIRGWLPER